MWDIHRSTTTWLARRTARSSAARPPHRSHRRRLTLEPLEGRALLSLTTWTVNSLGDSARARAPRATCATSSPRPTRPGRQHDQLRRHRHDHAQSALPDLSNTTGLMDIEGPGAASLTVARSGAAGTPDFRVFTVDPNVQANSSASPSQAVGYRPRSSTSRGGIDNGAR